MSLIVSAFEFLDGFARFVGWGAIVYGVLWLIGRALEDKRVREEEMRDQAAMHAFESYLSSENALKYEHYENLKRRYQFEGDEVHWHQIALECGVPRIEIIKKRQEQQ